MVLVVVQRYRKARLALEKLKITHLTSDECSFDLIENEKKTHNFTDVSTGGPLV